MASNQVHVAQRKASSILRTIYERDLRSIKVTEENKKARMRNSIEGLRQIGKKKQQL